MVAWGLGFWITRSRAGMVVPRRTGKPKASPPGNQVQLGKHARHCEAGKHCPGTGCQCYKTGHCGLPSQFSPVFAGFPSVRTRGLTLPFAISSACILPRPILGPKVAVWSASITPTIKGLGFWSISIHLRCVVPIWRQDPHSSRYKTFRPNLPAHKRDNPF
jgi:hypothetical protein